MYVRSYNIQYNFTMALQYKEEWLWNDILIRERANLGPFTIEE